MGLIERLKGVSQRAGNVAHQGLAKVRNGWGDAERSLRQRMRIYPKRPKLWGTQAGESGEPLLDLTEDMAIVTAAAEQPIEENRQPREPIVSVNGRDVEARHLDRDAA
jgi:hypothetical protein